MTIQTKVISLIAFSLTCGFADAQNSTIEQRMRCKVVYTLALQYSEATDVWERRDKARNVVNEFYILISNNNIKSIAESLAGIGFSQNTTCTSAFSNFDKNQIVCTWAEAAMSFTYNVISRDGSISRALGASFSNPKHRSDMSINYFQCRSAI